MKPTPFEQSSEVKFEIGHVLFIDIVGYSKLLITEQSEQLETLRKIVGGTEQVRAAAAEGKLLRLPTGDGGALVFHTSSEAPVRCAIEISKGLKDHPGLHVRMGIHSGPVNAITDLNDQANIAGAGINMAQRVMDCGDAGHILLSGRVAVDLEQYPRWHPYLHDLGEFKVKHSVRLGVVSLHGPEFGNAQLPSRLKATQQRRWMWTAAALLVGVAVVAGALLYSRQGRGKAVAHEKSVAVLPFENLSSDKENAYFTDGVQDEILTDLAKIADLKVISRTSVMQYKGGTVRNLREIGKQLGVAHVLEGSVQRSANRVRVTAQLIDARNDTHIWAEKYDRELADVFAIQSEIAQAIANQLRVKLSAREKRAINQRPTTDLAAHDLYLRAKELIYEGEVSLSRQRENLFQAAELLDQAITRDPAFLLAHCQLAATHDLIYFYNYDHTENRLKLAEASIANAVRLQPDAGETHLAQAIHFYWGYLNYDRGREELTKAEQSLPNDAQVFKFLGLIDRRQGRWDEAVRNLERFVELDPRNVDSFGNLADAYFGVRRYDEAMAMYDRIDELEPGNPAVRTFRPSVLLLARAEVPPLRDALKTIEAETPAAAADVWPLSFDLAQDERDPAAAARALIHIPREGYTDSSSFPFPYAWFEGLVAKLRKDASAAQSAFTMARSETEKVVNAQPGNAKPLSVLALIDAHLGEKEKAIQEARGACNILPIAKDAVDGVLLRTNLATVYALTGEKDPAVKELEMLSKTPGGPAYGDLRLAPTWDALRGDPHFEKILRSLAPK